MQLGFFNKDCMVGLKEYPDKYFNLAIVDPPYGNDGKVTRVGGTWASKYGTTITKWDIKPPQEFFDLLLQKSKYAIVWGGNYFSDMLPPSRNYIIWDKKSIPENFTMAMCEYAWTNIEGNAKIFRKTPNATSKNPRIHPTQKPIELYEWILQKYAKNDDIILDTHVGSGSSLIACERLEFEYVGFEVNEEYYEKAKERIGKYREKNERE